MPMNATSATSAGTPCARSKGVGSKPCDDEELAEGLPTRGSPAGSPTRCPWGSRSSATRPRRAPGGSRSARTARVRRPGHLRRLAEYPRGSGENTPQSIENIRPIGTTRLPRAHLEDDLVDPAHEVRGGLSVALRDLRQPLRIPVGVDDVEREVLRDLRPLGEDDLHARRRRLEQHRAVVASEDLLARLARQVERAASDLVVDPVDERRVDGLAEAAERSAAAIGSIENRRRS